MDLAHGFGGSQSISDDCSQIESGVGAETGPLNSPPTTSNHRITRLKTQAKLMVDSVIVVAQGVADLAWRTATTGFIHPCLQWRGFTDLMRGSRP
jgi:hypothetical protein